MGRTRRIRKASHHATEDIEAGTAHSRSGSRRHCLRTGRKPTGRKQQGTGALLLGLCRGFFSAHSWVRLHGNDVGLRRYSRYAVVLRVSVQPRLDGPWRRVRTSQSILRCGSSAALSFSCCVAWGNGLPQEQRPAWRRCWSFPSQCWKRDLTRSSGRNRPDPRGRRCGRVSFVVPCQDSENCSGSSRSRGQ